MKQAISGIDFGALKDACERRHPNIGVFGFADDLEVGEETHDYNDTRACYDWLARCAPSDRPCRVDSYGLKHVVERDRGEYVPNGALLLAAVMHGFRVERVSPGSPNGWLYISLPEAQKAEPSARPPISARLRATVLERDGFRCRRCGQGPDDGVRLVLDHVRPVAAGGETTAQNLQTLCHPCNAGKAARPPHSHDLRGLD